MSESSTQSLRKTVAALRRQADSDDWEEREGAGFAIRDLLEQHFDEGLALTKNWVSDPSERIRRASCLGCMHRKAVTTPKRVRVLLRRLSSLMADDSIYVRKCCGPFVVGYLGYTYPSETLPWLTKQATRRDVNVRANVAKAFSQALGTRHPEAALDTLATLVEDDRSRVVSAVRSAVRNVVKHHPQLKSDFAKRFGVSFVS